MFFLKASSATLVNGTIHALRITRAAPAIGQGFRRATGDVGLFGIALSDDLGFLVGHFHVSYFLCSELHVSFGYTNMYTHEVEMHPNNTILCSVYYALCTQKE